MIRLALIFLLSSIMTLPLGASEVKIFRGDSRDAFLLGTLDTVSVDPFGAIELAHQLDALSTLDEPFVFSAAAQGDGWVLGTGNDGRLLAVDAEGEVEVLYEAEQFEIFAVWVDPDGTIFAATSPYGKVIRIDAEGSEEIFDPPEAYIWDLLRDSSGRLLVATGSEGRVYRLAEGEKSGVEAEVIYESPDLHVRSLALLPEGEILVGTAGQGLIVKLDKQFRAQTLHDAVAPEVLDFAVRPDGVTYAALLATEASLVDLASATPASNGNGEDAEVTVSVQAQETIGSRAAGANGPRSLVISLEPDGTMEEIVSFEDETVHALLWFDDQLWIGTGQEGKLYRHQNDRLTLEHDLDEAQITALVAGKDQAAVVTTNASALYRLGREPASEGTYTSAVLDAEQPSRFGSFFWRGETPKKSGVTFSFRSGMSLEPDATWSPWTEATSGPELGLKVLPTGRYIQWRASLSSEGKVSPRLTTAELSYRQVNQRPVLQSLEVLDPGQILVPNNFNPSNQTFEPWSPNREGIFTTLKPAEGSDDSRLKNLWKKGYRTLRWKAVDPNSDTMNYRLEFRLDGDASWLPMVTELDETYYSFDSTVMPDGVYRFRVQASDKPAQSAAALDAVRVTEPVTIDHSPPGVAEISRRGGVIEVLLEDDLSPMREAVLSIDAQDWQPALPEDGLLDGRRETLRLEVPAETRMVLLRITDAALNVVTLDLLKALVK